MLRSTHRLQGTHGICRRGVTFRPMDEESCEVLVRGPLRAGKRIAGGIFGTVTGVAIGCGGGEGWSWPRPWVWVWRR